MDSIVPVATAGVEFFHFRGLTRRFPPHFHKTWLIGCLLSGKRALKVGSQKLELRPGDLVAIPPGTVHACMSASAEAGEWIGAHISPKAISHLPASHFYLFEPALTAKFRTAAGSALAGGFFSDWEWRNFIANLAEHLVGAPLNVNVETGAFAQTCAQMEKDPAQKLPLCLLAQDSGMRSYNFLRSFQKAIHITPGRYLTSLRVLKAQQLLAAGMDLAQCAISCGFYDQSHFSRIFKANLGITPGSYRAAMAKGGGKC